MQVRKAREARGWSQEHLASASGVSLRTVQRAEAGSKVSPENTLALCAALELRPPDIMPVADTDSATLPHVSRLRDALDDALADYGEAPVWRRSDPSPRIASALLREGLPADGAGFEEASQRIRRHQRVLGWFEFPMFLYGFPWALGMIVMPLLSYREFSEVVGRFPSVAIGVAAWIVAGIPLLLAVLRFETARARIEPSSPQDMVGAGVVVSDLDAIEVAWTNGFLWAARLVGREVTVIRIAEGSVRNVQIRRLCDGLHEAWVNASSVPWMPWCEDTSFKLTRLRDDDIRWLERRFGSLEGAVAWRPALRQVA